MRLPTGDRDWRGPAEGHCLGCDISARSPDVLRHGVEALRPFAEMEMRELSREALMRILETERNRAADGLAMADWFVCGTERPKGASPILAPLARFVTAIHLLANR